MTADPEWTPEDEAAEEARRAKYVLENRSCPDGGGRLSSYPYEGDMERRWRCPVCDCFAGYSDMEVGAIPSLPTPEEPSDG